MNKIRYINLCIVEFARKFGISAKIAFNYLKMHKGLEFLDNNYEAEHLLPLNDTIHDLAVLCKRNGGTIGCQREVTEEEAIKLCEENNLVWGGEHSVKNIEYDELKKLFESYVLKIYDIVGIKIKKTKKIDNYRPKRKIC